MLNIPVLGSDEYRLAKSDLMDKMNERSAKSY
jgi:hypothetical protein